jgi:oxygen-independent coproporphyrinogen-3 oxidase
MSEAPLSAYLHVPFCRHHCGYCNFTVIAGREDLAERYLEALAAELATLETPREVETLFIGGGTPTHLTLAQLERLLCLVNDWFPACDHGARPRGALTGQLQPTAKSQPTTRDRASEARPVAEGEVTALQDGSCSSDRPTGASPVVAETADAREFSVEANPRDALDVEKLRLLRRGGVTRISLGAQSFHHQKLRILERDHDAAIIREAVQNASAEGFDVALDLIFGTPGETLAGWQSDLEQALALAPDHLSTYGLTYEKGTTFWGRLARGELAQADEEIERAMYELAIGALTAAGFEHYEVSNFARPGQRCRHNEAYWLGREYFAAGPGAARYVAGRREANHRSTTVWMNRVLSGQSPVAESEPLSDLDRARERLVFGLRRLEGIDLAEFERRFGIGIDALAGDAIGRFVEQGLLARDASRLRLTRAGLLISDALWPYFLE